MNIQEQVDSKWPKSALLAKDRHTQHLHNEPKLTLESSNLAQNTLTFGDMHLCSWILILSAATVESLLLVTHLCFLYYFRFVCGIFGIVDLKFLQVRSKTGERIKN